MMLFIIWDLPTSCEAAFTTTVRTDGSQKASMIASWCGWLFQRPGLAVSFLVRTRNLSAHSLILTSGGGLRLSLAVVITDIVVAEAPTVRRIGGEELGIR